MSVQKFLKRGMGEGVAKQAYTAYGAVTGGLNHMGGKMPAWEELPPKIRDAWAAAANAALRAGAHIFVDAVVSEVIQPFVKDTHAAIDEDPA